jgi:maleate isomerase
MPDALGWRAKLAVVAPSTNTIVQPDMEAFRPEGVTNHFGRIHVPDMPVHDDADFVRLVEAIGATLDDCVDRVMTCKPDYLVMGMSALMFWDGREASARRMEDLAAHAGVPVSCGSFACEAALNLAGARRIAVISPYQPVSDREVTRFFGECGFEVVAFRGLRCTSPVNIAHVQEDVLRGHLREMDHDGIDAWVQVGTNLSMVRLAREMEAELGKPVIPINAATYWHALRAAGIEDRFPGHHWLFERH